ncbi:methyltransferase domain-containing protein [Clostridium sp. FP1]|uniref:methyltransferase domain-containing protein n=1 Tax=Clostridium sp. FP1 TaxID=2724076 RepID=UPI001CD02C68|nr:methyltransferase domain-containing protein [Clostridium sp. FP1]MBZ9635229.1 methyltransferase domain-containing protein [Clostridium sp. FP1]
MKFPNKAKILELGCGTGDLWNRNRENINEDWSITVSDFSKGMLESTKESLKPIGHNFTYGVIDAQDIPYEDESFDVVIARRMLYFVPDIEKALCEIKRILVKGGLFYVTTNSSVSMVELNEIVEKFDSKMGLNKIEILIAEENFKSRALPEKYGFKEEGIIRDAEWLNDKYVNHILYGILKSEWKY